MAATTLAIDDGQKTIAIVAAAPLKVNDANVLALLVVLDQVNALCPLASLVFTDGVTYTVTLKDSRAYAVAITLGAPPTFQITSASSWNQSEQTLLRALAAAFNALAIGGGVSVLTATYV
jgi:hypothetical protein